MERIICCTVIQFFKFAFSKNLRKKKTYFLWCWSLGLVIKIAQSSIKCILLLGHFHFLNCLCRSCLPLQIILQWTYDWTITFHWYTWIERRVFLSALLLYEVCSANIMTRVKALAHNISPFAQLSLYLSGKRGERE